MRFPGFLGLVLVISFLILPSCSIAASGERFTDNGYSFDISADQMGADILVRGIISGGDTTKKLIVTLHFQNEYSNRTSVKVIVNNYAGREPFSIRKKVSVQRSSRWFVSGVQIRKYD
jgi:hypothetical protein